MNDLLNISFHPAFLPSLDFTLNIGKQTGEVTCKTYKLRNPATNDPPQTIVYDSLTFLVHGPEYLKFIKRVDSLDLKNHKSPKFEGLALDGISTYVKYNSNEFHFWSPNRKVYITEYQLLDAFFDFTNNTFTDKETIKYLGYLKGYFDYGSQ